MTPLQFEGHYQSEWDELQYLLTKLQLGARKNETPVAGERLASLYRRACEQLALARARSYPAHIVDRLNQLAHPPRRELLVRQAVEIYTHLARAYCSRGAIPAAHEEIQT